MEKDDKKKKLSKPKSTSSVINTNPQLPGVNEEGSAVAKDPVIEKVLSLTQRRERALSLRKNATKIKNAKAIAKTRFAPDSRLKKRAQEMARNIVRRKFAGQRGAEYTKLSPSDKMNVDRLIDKKLVLIKKLADKLFPRVKKAESQRLASIATGKQAVKAGALGKSPLMQAVDISLHRKAEKSGIPFEIISEVFKRGYNAWNPDMKHTAEQNAFHRVNSYIAGGKARELDKDLIETKDPCWKDYKMVGMKKKNGKPVPNCVPEETMQNEGIIGDALKKAAAQTLSKQGGTIGSTLSKKIMKTVKEDSVIDTKPKLKDKTVKREIATLPLKSKDPMSEHCGCDDKMSVKKLKKVLKK